MILKLLSASVLFVIKGFTRIFYRTHVTWHTPQAEIQWEDLKLAVVLNHTSLFEFLFVSALPNKRVWRAVDRVVIPVADVTLKRPIAGFFFKILLPNAVAITRKRDDSWSAFLDKINGGSLAIIFPEGRMMRKDGLDKNGQPMSVKGGVVEIIQKIESGKILIAYSGGLHHVQAPGDLAPKIFKRIEIGFEQIDINEYKKSFEGQDLRAAIIADLEERKKKNC